MTHGYRNGEVLHSQLVGASDMVVHMLVGGLREKERWRCLGEVFGEVGSL